MRKITLHDLVSCRIWFSIVVIAAYTGPVSSEARHDELGRLFTDSVQREKLEAVRYDDYDDVESTDSITAVTVNGLVLRDDGKSVVWVNGKSTLEGQPETRVIIHTQGADRNTYSVPIEIDGQHVRMKPGQSWSDGTGTVRDNY